MSDESTRTEKSPRPEQWPSRELHTMYVLGRRGVHRLQDRLVQLLGSSTEGRATLVAERLRRDASEATSYWLQLFVSIGIATLGLVVGSAAVIIGAMLVAPLMGPIVALALGLATGSPFLVLRSGARIVISVAVTIGGAAIITLLLPFHELNSEIAGRIAPTVLDLVTACFCALAGVYASMRPGSDTATTAAGTSIGISLVPPLCASGYGLGTGSLAVAGGAALLFLTNLVAIIVIGSLAFVAAGFERVNITTLEREELAAEGRPLVTGWIAKRLAGMFESRGGPALRFLMPIMLLATVYVPLRRALDEVAWQVRTRAAVQESIDREPARIVQTRIRVERRTVDLQLVMLGTNAEASRMRARLEREIARASEVTPHVEVLAIPDASALAGLESTLLTSRTVAPAVQPVEVPPAKQLENTQALFRSEVARLWPETSAGAPLAIELGANDSGPLRLRIVHLGRALGADAIEGFERSLGAALDVTRTIRLIDVAIPSEQLTRALGDFELVSRVTYGVLESASMDDLSLCVIQPEPPARKRTRERDREREDEALQEALQRAYAGHPHVVVEQKGAEWSLQFVRGTCPAPASTQTQPEGGAPQNEATPAQPPPATTTSTNTTAP